jgi:hypothetical protein
MLMQVCLLLKYMPTGHSSRKIGSGTKRTFRLRAHHVARSPPSQVSIAAYIHVTSTWKGSPGWPAADAAVKAYRALDNEI